MGYGGASSSGGARGDGGSGGAFSGNGLTTGKTWYGTTAHFDGNKNLKGYSSNGQAFTDPLGRPVRNSQPRPSASFDIKPVKPNAPPPPPPPVDFPPVIGPWEDVPPDYDPLSSVSPPPPPPVYTPRNLPLPPGTSSVHRKNVPSFPMPGLYTKNDIRRDPGVGSSFRTTSPLGSGGGWSPGGLGSDGGNGYGAGGIGGGGFQGGWN